MNRELWLEARAIAGRRVPDREGREDLAQDLVVAALERAGGVERVGAWLERVARNAVIDRWRVERRREELAAQVSAPAPAIDPEATLLARERRRLIRAALVALPRGQRRVTVLRFHRELSFEGVGARLGIGTVTARTRLHRALATMRSKLGELRALLPSWPGASLWPAAQTAAFTLALVSTEAATLRSSPITISSLASDDTTLRPRGLARSRTVAAEGPAPADRQGARASADGPAPREAGGVPPPSVFVFDDDQVRGDVVGPDGENIEVIRPAVHSSLIEIRRHFVAEMVKSLEEL